VNLLRSIVLLGTTFRSPEPVVELARTYSQSLIPVMTINSRRERGESSSSILSCLSKKGREGLYKSKGGKE